jgi:hypothetical protein
MTITVKELREMLADLPETMRVVCAYPYPNKDFSMVEDATEITASHSLYVENFENERGGNEVAFVISVFDPIEHIETVSDSVPPSIGLGED